MLKKYSQNWSNYAAAQCSEKSTFMKILFDLCRELDQPRYKFGRPSIPISDMIFCTVMKVYSVRSLRRFVDDLKIAKDQDYISKSPCFASIGHFMQKEEISSILLELIKKTSLPLKAVETKFAVDSSGFSTCRHARWFDQKYGKSSEKRIWIKAHLTCGVKTNIVTSVILTDSKDNDSPFLKQMINETAENFNLREVSADKAYSSRDNLETIHQTGVVPFIPFKSNVTGKARGSLIWRKMYHYFMYNQEEFMEHYHKRSNVETTFHMIKTKFGDSLKNKTRIAQINEILCKILCHNVYVLIHELQELRGNFKFKTVSV